MNRTLSLILILTALVLVILAALGHVLLWWAVLCLVAEGLTRTLPLTVA